MLLTRDDFRTGVFARDKVCVLCKAEGQDAHHIMERRLFPDGGYYLDNGALVCGNCHLACESTDISVEEVMQAAGITRKILPPHMYYDERYDKWGNIILPNGQRTKGELFYDESVQKILSGKLGLFTDYVKYPRTYHLPWSAGMNDDDRQMPDVSVFEGKVVVVTEKMDGENTTMYRDHIHARSVTSGGHPSRNWVKNYWGKIQYEIPAGWRICGENLYAKHSIWYTRLESLFLGFSVWTDRNICLSWPETLEYFSLLNILPVRVLYYDVFNEDRIKALYDEDTHYNSCEGYVVRLADAFGYGQFRNSVGKYVRAKHVMTTKHWMHGQAIEPNIMKEKI